MNFAVLTSFNDFIEHRLERILKETKVRKFVLNCIVMGNQTQGVRGRSTSQKRKSLPEVANDTPVFLC